MPKKTNGSLILVRATHCARSWGIAAFASKRDIQGPLTATFISNPANQYQHMWQTNDSKWKTSIGPSSLELKELGGKEPPLNQCIGVIISSLRLDDATWRANFESLLSLSDHGSSFDHGSSSDCGSLSDGSSFGVMSQDSWNSIHIDDNSGSATTRLWDYVPEMPTGGDNINDNSGRTARGFRWSNLLHFQYPNMILDYIRGGLADTGGGDSTHINDNSVVATGRLLDPIQERPTNLQHTSEQSDGVLVLLDLSSNYTDALPLFRLHASAARKLMGLFFLI